MHFRLQMSQQCHNFCDDEFYSQNEVYICRDVERFFVGHHITMTVRNEDDLDLAQIHEKLSKAISSQYNFKVSSLPAPYPDSDHDLGLNPDPGPGPVHDLDPAPFPPN